MAVARGDALMSGEVGGIGRVSEHILREFGVTRCGDFAAQRGLLGCLFSATSVSFFLVRPGCPIAGMHAPRTGEEVALGIGSTEHDHREDSRPGGGRKGISNERTFAPISTWAQLSSKAEELAQSLVQ
eukprot:gene21676-26071_t